MLKAIRSFLFNMFFYVYTGVVVAVLTLFLVFPRVVFHGLIRGWARGLMMGLRLIAGIRFEVRGLENLNHRGVIFACKHQSAWETGVFFLLVDMPVYVLKKELLSIPVWGWCARKTGMLAVDRSGGASALKQLVRGACQRLDAGDNIIIFPEGTRTIPGRSSPYHPGVAAIYNQAKVPVVPVALNSGVFLGRHSFTKNPGVITIEFLEPIKAGKPRKVFMAELQNTINEASNRLAIEACEKYNLPLPTLSSEKQDESAKG